MSLLILGVESGRFSCFVGQGRDRTCLVESQGKDGQSKQSLSHKQP